MSSNPHPSIWAFLALRLSPERIEALQEALKRQLQDTSKVSATGEYKDLRVSWDRLCWARWRIPNSPIESVFDLDSEPNIHLSVGSCTTGFRLSNDFEIRFVTTTGRVCGINHIDTARDIIKVFRRKASAHKAARRSH